MIKIPEGFIPLIEYEEKFNDKLLIMFPSFTYRKNNIIYNEHTNKFKEIKSVTIDYRTGYRIPILEDIEYDKDTRII